MRIKNFIKSEKWTLVSLLLLVVTVLIGSPALLAADLTVTPTPSAGKQGGSAGLATQIPGSPTTVSGVAAAEGGVGGDGLIQPDIDDQIFLIGTDETVLDGIMRKAKRKIKVSGFEVDHYLIDERKAYAETTANYTIPGSGAEEQATLTVAVGDRKFFQENGTLLAKGVNGYSDDGQSVQTGVDLMLFIVGKDSSGNPIVRAVNGPKQSATNEFCTVPAIPSGTKLIFLVNACAETQKEVAPNVIVPTPTRVYLQKMIMNQVISDYFDAQKKRIPFQSATIAEAMVKEFRRECNRTLWVGHKGKFNVDRGKLGTQTIYTTEGVRWQIPNVYQHTGDWTFANIVELSKKSFTGNSTSKKAWWLCGKDLLEGVQNIDFTKHKDITMTSAEVWGFACTQLHTVFGDFYLKHEPTLDYLDYSADGAILDLDGLARYYNKNEEASTDEIEGEEAKRKSIISINALALKGVNHYWVENV